MSEFLDFEITDEVIDGTPKYNITDNDDGTKNIELANEVVTEGTAINKGLLEKINVANNVLGYNTPILEKEEYGTTTITDALPISADSFSDSNTFTSEKIYADKYTITMTTDLSVFYASTSSRSNYMSLSIRSGSSNYTTSGYLLSWAKTTAYNSNSYVLYTNGSTLAKNVYLNYDFGVKCKVSFTGCMYTASSVTLQGSNDNSNWTNIASISNSTTNSTYTSDNYYRYYRLIYPIVASSSMSKGAGIIYVWYVSSIIGPTYKNKFTFSTFDKLINNQKILMASPATVTQTNVEKNTINNIDCDTLITANKKYELIYNASSNKILAYEHS